MDGDGNQVGMQPLQPLTCLCIFCGLPASGKSTLARAVRALTVNEGWRATVVSYDEIILDEAFRAKSVDDHGLQQPPTEWKVHRQAILQCVEHILQNPQGLAPLTSSCHINSDAWRFCVQALQLTGTVENSKTEQCPVLILLDDNFYYPSMRYEVYQLARKYSLGFCQVYLHCPVEACIERNLKRPQPLPTKVILDMAQRMDPPSVERNSWEKNSIALDSTSNLSQEDMQRLLELLSCAVNNPLSPVKDDTQQKEADRLSCASSVVHQADQACRRLVSEAMKSARESKVPPECMRSLSAELTESKTRLLHHLRKQALQGFPNTQGEDLDLEQVLKRAVDIFDQDKIKVMSKYTL
ncbi:L-seryl-tRNA(Sec) kinase [Aplochiton taeniatus]